MAKNKMSDLRDHLFDTLERLKSNNDPNADDNEKIDIDTAKTIIDVSGCIIDTWKVEVQAIGIMSKHSDTSLMIGTINNSGLFSENIKAIEEKTPTHEKFR